MTFLDRLAEFFLGDVYRQKQVAKERQIEIIAINRQLRREAAEAKRQEEIRTRALWSNGRSETMCSITLAALTHLVDGFEGTENPLWDDLALQDAARAIEQAGGTVLAGER